MTALTYGNAAEWQITKIHLSSCPIPDDTQKAVKRIAKDGLLQAERPPFGLQKAVFYKHLGHKALRHTRQDSPQDM
jgi:hypothetical protein